MTMPVHADPRRSGASVGLGFSEPASGDGSAFEMPVLFQLSDLAQFKVLSPPDRPRTQQPATTTPAADSPPPMESKAAPPESTSLESKSPPKADHQASGAIEQAAPSATEQPLLAAVTQAVEPTTAPSDSPTIRERAQLRERRRQAAVQGDWFQTQGKYILVVFLVLLVGVIYAARRGSDDSPPSPALESDLAIDAPAPLPAGHELGEQLPANTAPLAAAPSAASGPGLAATASAGSAATESGPVESTSTEAPAAEFAPPLEQSPAADIGPQVTLQAPVQAETAEQRPANTDLFPWANQPEARVATRPEAVTQDSSGPLPQANPHFQARPTDAPAAGAPQQPAEALPTAYPSTGFEVAPAPSSPQLPAATAPAAYPVADPAPSQSSLTKPPRGTTSTGVIPASYENRIPSATRTSGPRYERTGSGLY